MVAPTCRFWPSVANIQFMGCNILRFYRCGCLTTMDAHYEPRSQWFWPGAHHPPLCHLLWPEPQWPSQLRLLKARIPPVTVVAMWKKTVRTLEECLSYTAKLRVRPCFSLESPNLIWFSARGLNWGVCVSTYVLPIEVFPEETHGCKAKKGPDFSLAVALAVPSSLFSDGPCGMFAHDVFVNTMATLIPLIS